ncbi:unnamed protein product [Psylliodes chrysocephalus]|uniref:CRAL-TRIO domain-containing protein n=1 Tax=Psylliodes chrysocephalus TaxID=3402493 RepID=A0A9P0CLW6_9CUCU|nr:unnamed protein product [Psylliodes chrysocephala]
MSCTMDERTKQRILGLFGRSMNDLNADVQLVKNWLCKQNHIPEIPSKHMIEYFIVSNRFSIETTKERLSMYYNIRKLFPSAFQAINPKTNRMKMACSAQYVLPLPKLVDGLYRVIIVGLKEGKSDKFDADCMMGNVLNVYEIRMQEDLTYEDVLILDYQNLHLTHVIRTTPRHAQMVKLLLEKVYNNRLKEIHIINHSILFNLLFKLAQPLISQNLHKKIHFHDSLSSLLAYIPLDVLPKDYGGNEKSVEELEEMWKGKMKKYQHRFDELDELTINVTRQKQFN